MLVVLYGILFIYIIVRIVYFVSKIVKSKKDRLKDIEVKAEPENRERELFLFREREFIHQHNDCKWRLRDVATLKLKEFLDVFHDSHGVGLCQLKVITDKVVAISDPLVINGFDLLSPLVKKGENGFLVDSEFATLIVWYAPLSKESPDDQQMITINLKFEGEVKSSFYFRVTCFIPPISISRDVLLGSQVNIPQAYSILIAFDKSSDSQRTNEFEFFWEDAKEKLLAGKTDDLTDEQRLICDCSLKNASYHLYWGKKRFSEERYYEASLYLENAFYILHPKYYSLKDSEKETFYEVCFLIGFCYCEFRQYQRAYYFLKIASGQNRISYNKEYINCLANSKDFRTIPIINDLLHDLLTHQKESGDPLSLHLSSFVNFLRRRKGYAFIDLGQLDKAEKVFTAMLNEPENNDFALGELAYIQSLKSKKDPQVS